VNIGTIASRHWFYLLIPIWVASSWSLRSSYTWDVQPNVGEAIVLFDWCIFVPATFAVCYRTMTPSSLALRVLALMCGGIWVAGKMVPPDAQMLLRDWSSIRWLGLSIVLLFEVAAMAAMLRIVFGEAPDPRALEQQGIPPFVAKLMIAEAKFWRWLWARLAGKR
jgi:hypothetical protein